MKMIYLAGPFAALASVALAQSPPQRAPAQPLPQLSQPLTQQQAVDFARLHSPAILGAREHAAAVQANEITAGLRLNPYLVGEGTQVSLANTDPNGPPFYGLGLQRTFEVGGKRTLRLQVARANTSLAGAQVDDQALATSFLVPFLNERNFSRACLT